MAVTAANLIRTAMQDLGVLGAGEAADGSHMQDGLRRLNLLIGAWGLDPLTAVRTQGEMFDVVPGKSMYSIGPGLDFNTQSPVGQQSIAGAARVQRAGQQDSLETPVGLMTYDQWIGIQVKNLQSPLFTHVLFVPGSQSNAPVPNPPEALTVGASVIILWPVPTEANLKVMLYSEKVIPQFADLTASYPMTDSYAAAVQYNLTMAMAPMFQVEPPPFVVMMAAKTLASMKRNNYQFTDVALDPMFTFGGGAGYDIYSGGTTRHG